MTADDGVIVTLWPLEKDFSIADQNAAHTVGEHEVILLEQNIHGKSSFL